MPNIARSGYDPLASGSVSQTRGLKAAGHIRLSLCTDIASQVAARLVTPVTGMHGGSQRQLGATTGGADPNQCQCDDSNPYISHTGFSSIINAYHSENTLSGSRPTFVLTSASDAHRSALTATFLSGLYGIMQPFWASKLSFHYQIAGKAAADRSAAWATCARWPPLPTVPKAAPLLIGP